jgi:hypothetical protein
VKTGGKGVFGGKFLLILLLLLIRERVLITKKNGIAKTMPFVVSNIGREW